MTAADLQNILRSAPKSLKLSEVEVKTSGDFYKGPGGSARFGYACCAMGDCQWSETPRPHYSPVLYLPSSLGPD
jgi:hypothetical protein